MSYFIELVIFCITHYAALGIFLFLSYLWGGIVLEIFFPKQPNERIFLNTTTGLGLLIVFLFYSALLSILYPAIIACFLLVAPVYCIYQKKYSIVLPRSNLGQKTTLSNCIAMIMAVVLVPILLPPLFPPTAWDETAYHLPYASFYAQNNGLAVNQFLRFPLYSHNYNLLYSLALLFYDDILAHLFHAAAALLTAIGIYILGRETYNRAVGFIAASIFLSSPSVLELMASSYIDLGLTLFVFLNFYGIIRWSQTRNGQWLYLAGFGAGIAAGTKYSALFFLLIFTLWVIADSRQIRPVLKFLIPAFIFGSPWYVRNFFISGDPFSPFGGEIFGYWVWDKADLQNVLKDLMDTHRTVRGFSSFLQLPLNLAFHPELFGQNGLSPGVLALFPSFLMFGWLDKLSRKIVIFVLVNLLFWFFGTQIIRYLLPVLPMIALVSSVAIVQIFERVVRFPINIFNKKKTYSYITNKSLLSIPIFFSMTCFIPIDYDILKKIYDEPIPITETMRKEYLGWKIPAYKLIEVANDFPEFLIYQLGFESSFYFAEGMMIGDWVGYARYSNIKKAVSDPEILHGTLRNHQARLFLVNKKLKMGKNLLQDRRFSQYFEEIAQTPDGALFYIK